MAVVIMLVHTYYGYTARGGPAGVGEAVGRAVRTSLVACGVRGRVHLAGRLRAVRQLQLWRVSSMASETGRSPDPPGVVDAGTVLVVIARIVWTAHALFAGTFNSVRAGHADLRPRPAW